MLKIYQISKKGNNITKIVAAVNPLATNLSFKVSILLLKGTVMVLRMECLLRIVTPLQSRNEAWKYKPWWFLSQNLKYLISWISKLQN